MRPIPDAAIEILAWSALVTTGASLPDALQSPPPVPPPKPIGARPVFDGREAGGRAVPVPVYDRAAMRAGARVPDSGDQFPFRVSATRG